VHSEKVIQDSGHGVTILYYYNVEKGFKFIGDDPEGKVIPIPKDVRDRVYKNNNVSGLDSDMPAEAYLDKFYLHNRCLLFPSGVWMSETAGVPHALINKPGTYLNFKMAGMTRLTALTDNASAICIGPDPDKDIGYYNRTVHKIDADIIFDRTDKLLVATEEMWYDGDIVKAGQPYHVQRTGKLKLLKSGYVVEFWLDDINIEESVTDYVNMWINKQIQIRERNAKNQA
tara:strand:- start:16 stop:702 length:687 start_codon:yes stop_codon:yes gene_type:complete